MALSPHEVETKQFLTVLRGFDQEEVQRFLADVAEEMRLLLQALYAALPPGSSISLGEEPHLEDLVEVGAAAAAETARLAAAGRAAQVDAIALVQAAETKSLDIQTTSAKLRVNAVREAGKLLAKAHEEAARILAVAHERERDVHARVRALDGRLRQAEELLRDVRETIDVTAELDET